MKTIHVSSQAKHKMLQTLQRSHEQDLISTESYNADDDDGREERSILSEETLQKLSEGKNITLQGLSNEERKAFLQAVKSGKVSHLIKPWDPWWLSDSAKKLSLSKQGTKLIQTLERNPRKVFDVEVESSDIPAPPEKPLDSLKKLTLVQPSPLLGVHILDVLYSYCFTLRLFNGDWISDPLDAAEVIVSISRVLGQAFSPESISEALLGCLETVCSPCFRHVGGYDLGLTICEDLVALLRIGKAAVICALADLQRMLESATRSWKSYKKRSSVELATGKVTDTLITDHTKTSLHSHARNRTSKASSMIPIGSTKYQVNFKPAVNKLNFFLSWANESDNELFRTLAELVEKEKSRLSETRRNESSLLQVNTFDKDHKIKPMLEEIG
ncbi:hypothetical protein O6H91_22G063700 [Diphasiastrum complanatum]|nr:hypothetical protein O6H91_22G063700 [Diphasiastrum complanatum]